MVLVQKEIKAVYTRTPEVVSDMEGPCDAGFHVPTKDEWNNIIIAGITMGAWTSSSLTNLIIYLHLPLAGNLLKNDGTRNGSGTNGYYWTSIAKSNSSSDSFWFGLTTSGYQISDAYNRAYACTIRPLKDTAEAPTSSWTRLYNGGGTKGIYWNSTEGLITLSSDGTTRYTIADKNLGANTVYNNGDTLSESNCGKYYQRGNNYGFPYTGATTTSSTQVDASVYGPGNYFSNSTFISRGTAITGWDSSNNKNLWGGVTQQTGTVLTEHKIRPSGWTPTASTLAYYPLEKDVLDYSGNGNNATGNPNSFTGGVANYSWASTTLPTSLVNSASTPVTMSVWINAGTQDVTVLGQHTNQNRGFSLIYNHTNSSYRIIFDVDSGVGYTTTYQAVYQDSSALSGWHHVVCMRDSSKIYLYLDGQYVTETSQPGVASNNTFYLGYDHGYGGGAWNGKVSKLIFENRVWTAQEVSDYYNQTKSIYGL